MKVNHLLTKVKGAGREEVARSDDPSMFSLLGVADMEN
jgi:hypothetical protein